MKKKQFFSNRTLKIGLFSALITSQLFLPPAAIQAQENKVEVHYVDFDSLTKSEKERIKTGKLDKMEGAVYTLVYQKEGQGLPSTGDDQSLQVYAIGLGSLLLVGSFLLVKRRKRNKYLCIVMLVLGGVTVSGLVYAATELKPSELVLLSDIGAKSIEGYEYLGYIVDQEDQVLPITSTASTSALSTSTSATSTTSQSTVSSTTSTSSSSSSRGSTSTTSSSSSATSLSSTSSSATQPST